jgi:hypothetical protein
VQSSLPGAFVHCQSFLGGAALGFLAVARPFLEPLAGLCRLGQKRPIAERLA